MSWWRRFWHGDDPAPAVASSTSRGGGFFSTDMRADRDDPNWLGAQEKRVFQRTHDDFRPVSVAGQAMDDASDLDMPPLKGLYALGGCGVPDVQLEWYASQSFIGYQACALLAQHWLIDKACTMPARDTTRNGYEITVNDGTKVDPKVLDYMRKLDVRYKIKAESREFIRMCRMYGIRIALFEVTSADEEYYTKPFNPDGVASGSYKGISQVDPYWITPELDMDAAANPASRHFYEPTYWRINGRRYHRSHLVIIRTCDVPDVLKPSYFYGGVPLPQRIFERVYAAERTANEAPQLALTKRSTIIHVDMDKAIANQVEFNKKMQTWRGFLDNYGIKVAGLEESIEQIDTALTDMNDLIMGQYQLVCSIAETPATKLLGTQPKGFNSTGDYEEASYHELCESLNEHDVRPLVERHHLLCIRSDVAPKFGIAPFETTVVFNELDAETGAEKAERQLKESAAHKNWFDMGALDGIDVRGLLVNDPDSGFSGIPTVMPEGPQSVHIIDPGAEKTAPNDPTPAEQVAPGGASGAPGGGQ